MHRRKWEIPIHIKYLDVINSSMLCNNELKTHMASESGGCVTARARSLVRFEERFSAKSVRKTGSSLCLVYSDLNGRHTTTMFGVVRNERSK